jgi:long-chain acyl-CoA synthetase
MRNKMSLLYFVLLGKNPSPAWDKLVFNKIKARPYGRVRLMSLIASPLPADVSFAFAFS